MSMLFMLPHVSFSAAEPLTGIVKLSCEALLCLGSGGGVSECRPSIKEYFSITRKKPSDTFKARRNFLSICPTDDSSGIAASINEKYGQCNFSNPFSVSGGAICNSLLSSAVGGTFGNCISFALNSTTCSDFRPSDSEITEFVTLNQTLNTGRTISLFGICRDEELAASLTNEESLSCENFSSKQTFLDRRF